MSLSERTAAVKSDLLARPGVAEERPFGPGVIVYKLMGKMFALMPADGAASISLKCDPHLAEILRDQYEGVTAGYHLNKRHWNTVRLAADVPQAEILRLIGHSYDLVRASLTRRQRADLQAAGE
ncbi:MAG: MmcQ/YjbR family DNA-binding protein [Caulobacteraceae bacterium]